MTLGLLKNLGKLLPKEEGVEERDFFEAHVKTYFEDYFPRETLEEHLEKCKEWTLSN